TPGLDVTSPFVALAPRPSPLFGAPAAGTSAFSAPQPATPAFGVQPASTFGAPAGSTSVFGTPAPAQSALAASQIP
ncbi:uncharacterized protein LAESUDRAFT_733118, partial [Laetiporus sulphureus 93-53]